MLSTSFAAKSGKPGNGQASWHSHWSSHYQRNETCKCAKTVAQSASLAIPAGHVKDPAEQAQTPGRKDHRWGTGRFPYGKQYYRTNLQSESTDGKLSTTSTRFMPRFYRLQKGFRQGQAHSALDHHAQIQHRWQPHHHHHKRSTLRWKHSRLLPDNGRS